MRVTEVDNLVKIPILMGKQGGDRGAYSQSVQY